MKCLICGHKLNLVERYLSNICDNCTNFALLKISRMLNLKKKNKRNMFELVDRQEPSSTIKDIIRETI